MAADKGERRQIIMADDLWTNVEKIAQVDRVSKSAVIRIATRDYIRKRKKAAGREKKTV